MTRREWSTPDGQSAGGPVHVVPLNDLREHVLEPLCPCMPRLIHGAYRHNSYDGREVREVVLRALDGLGVALADYGHEWSASLREDYEHAVELMDIHHPVLAAAQVDPAPADALRKLCADLEKFSDKLRLFHKQCAEGDTHDKARAYAYMTALQHLHAIELPRRDPAPPAAASSEPTVRQGETVAPAAGTKADETAAPQPVSDPYQLPAEVTAWLRWVDKGEFSTHAENRAVAAYLRSLPPQLAYADALLKQRNEQHERAEAAERERDDLRAKLAAVRAALATPSGGSSPQGASPAQPGEHSDRAPSS